MISYFALGGRVRACLALSAAVFALAAGMLSGCASAGSAGAASEAGTAAPAPAPVTIDVSAAATLKAAFEEMAPALEASVGVSPVFNFGASGQLQKQIEGGAPCDVFASASPKQVDTLVSEGLISAEETSTYCYNEVVIFVPAGNPAGIHTPEDLTRAQRLTTGDPETAPHGTKSKEWLEAIGLWDALAPKFVFAENAAQTSDFVARGEVDAGLGFASEATGRDDIEVVYTAPAEESRPSRYVLAPLVASEKQAAARKFIEYVLSDEGQAVLAGHGFLVGER